LSRVLATGKHVIFYVDCFYDVKMRQPCRVFSDKTNQFAFLLNFQKYVTILFTKITLA